MTSMSGYFRFAIAYFAYIRELGSIFWENESCHIFQNVHLVNIALSGGTFSQLWNRMSLWDANKQFGLQKNIPTPIQATVVHTNPH